MELKLMSGIIISFLSMVNKRITVPLSVCLSVLLYRRGWWPGSSCTPQRQLLEGGLALAPCPGHPGHLHMQALVGVYRLEDGTITHIDWRLGWPATINYFWKCNTIFIMLIRPWIKALELMGESWVAKCFDLRLSESVFCTINWSTKIEQERNT